MKKDIKKLLAKENLTADETGRLMILDLLSAYKDLSNGGEGAGVLSGAEKMEIVSRLTNPEDISRFNDFKGVHTYLTTVPAVYDSVSKTYEIYYWKLHYLLSNMGYAEEETVYSNSLPVIMNDSQYNEFKLSGAPCPPGGVAVLRDAPQNPAVISRPAWREEYKAENILSKYSFHIEDSLCGMKDTLAECFARQKALELVGRFIKVPKVKILISPVDEKRITLLNEFMETAVNYVSRGEGYAGDYSRELRQRLSKLLTPIDAGALKPRPDIVGKARRRLSFSVIKNESEAFIAMIKREWRDDCAE